MLTLDFDSGEFSINDRRIFFRSAKIEHIKSFLSEGNLLILKLKKTVILRTEIKEKINNYYSESLVIEFKIGICKKIIINLLPSESDIKINSVFDLSIAIYLRDILHQDGNFDGRSKLTFKMQWGEIVVIFDIKLSCASLCISYN